MSEPINIPLVEDALIIAFFWFLLYYFFGFYTEIYRKSRIKEFFNLFGLSMLGTIIVFFTLLLDDEGVQTYTSYYKTISTYFGIHFFITALFKISLISYVKDLVRKRKLYFNTILVGTGPKAVELFNEINKSYELLGLRFLAAVPLEENKQLEGQQLRSIGSTKTLATIVRRCHAEQVIIALEPEELPSVQPILYSLEDVKNIRISITPAIHQYLMGSIRVNHSFDIPLLDINQELMPQWQTNLKRISDIGFSLFVLVGGMSFFLLIALLVKLTSKGPILFKQERIGKDGIPFFIYKFRSMYVDAEKNGPALSKSGDSRITPLGKFLRKSRIDEFPQFYNVLIGDMSLVGPRPERQFFIDQIIKIAPYYKHLHKVRPGITSLGQVKYGYAQNVEEMIERLKYDILYIENMSFAMDLRILLYTILVMIQGRGK